MKPGDDKDNTDPKKGINKEPAEEQQLEEKDKPVKQPAPESDDKEEDENTLGQGLDDAEFDEFDENGGDDDFSDAAKINELKKEEATEVAGENLAGEEEQFMDIEGSSLHITNKAEEIVNKKGQ